MAFIPNEVVGSRAQPSQGYNLCGSNPLPFQGLGWGSFFFRTCRSARIKAALSVEKPDLSIVVQFEKLHH
jgi:hypothetical protein